MTVRSVLLAAAIAAAPSVPDAEEPVRIGVAAPLTEADAILGAQVLLGARQAGAKSGAVPIEADTACTQEGGRRAAETLVAEKVAIAVGFLCTDALEAALPVLTAAAIPVIDVGVRADRFTGKRAKTGQLVWRIAPRADAEARAVAALIAARWRDVPFGIVDDGSLYGRGLADAVRTQLETEGLKPALVDNYRPSEEKQFGLVRRIVRSGVTHVFVAGDRADASVIAQDAASSDLALQVIGGEQFLDEPPDGANLPVGTLVAAPRNRFPLLPSSAGAVDEARQGYFGPAYVATEIAAEAVRQAGRDGRSLGAILNTTEFRTALGAVRFDAKGDTDLDLFTVLRFDGRDFRTETGG